MVDPKTVVFFLGLFFAGQVTSAPTSDALVARGDPLATTWTEPAFLGCVTKKYPNFPSGTIDPNDLINCRNSLGKRDVDTGLDDNDIVAKLATRDTDSDLDPKNIVAKLAERGLDTDIQARGALRNLISNFQANVPDCPDKDLPKNFEEAAPMRAKAQGLCQQMGTNLLNNGWAAVKETLGDAYTKHDIWLYGNQKVVLDLVLTFTPQGRQALAAAKVTSATLASACEAAVVMLATKGQGCTDDIHFSEDFIFKGAQTTGVTNGIMDMFFNNNALGFISASFSQPS